MRRGLEILYGLYFGVVFLLWIVPTWTIVHFIRDYRKAGRFTSAALKILFALIGCRVRVVGKEYVDSPGAKVYASNHTSYFDVLPLMLGLGRAVSLRVQNGSRRNAVHRNIPAADGASDV